MLWTYSQFPEIPGNNSGSERLNEVHTHLVLVLGLNGNAGSAGYP